MNWHLKFRDYFTKLLKNHQNVVSEKIYIIHRIKQGYGIEKEVRGFLVAQILTNLEHFYEMGQFCFMTT